MTTPPSSKSAHEAPKAKISAGKTSPAGAHIDINNDLQRIFGREIDLGVCELIVNTPYFLDIIQDLEKITNFAIAMANGDISQSLEVKGNLAGSLKSLQANLRHLTWQTQMIAKGDFTQQIDYMGEFSVAFNHMVRRLGEISQELESQQEELIRRNDQLIAEMAEREKIETAEREQRQLAEALQDAGKVLSSTLDFDHVLELMLLQIEKVIPFDSAAIMIVEGDTAHPIRTKNYQRYGEEIAQNINQAVFQIRETENLYLMNITKKPLVIPNIKRFPKWNRSTTKNPLCSWVGTPIIANDKVIAFFSLDKLEPDYYNQSHADKLAMFAGHAALAMQNASLFKNVQQLAIHDSLTGMLNRRHFFELARTEFTRSIRYQHELAVIMMDLDHFKTVNDQFGHQAGDLVLKTVAQTCEKTIRNSDLLCRYGGDEFVFLLPETGYSIARIVAERLRENITRCKIVANQEEIHITVSIGIGCLTQGSDGPPNQLAGIEQIIAQADEALYAAKAAGRNIVSFENQKTIDNFQIKGSEKSCTKTNNS